MTFMSLVVAQSSLTGERLKCFLQLYSNQTSPKSEVVCLSLIWCTCEISLSTVSALKDDTRSYL